MVHYITWSFVDKYNLISEYNLPLQLGKGWGAQSTFRTCFSDAVYIRGYVRGAKICTILT